VKKYNDLIENAGKIDVEKISSDFKE